MNDRNLCDAHISCSVGKESKPFRLFNEAIILALELTNRMPNYMKILREAKVKK